jgi:putative transposase
MKPLVEPGLKKLFKCLHTPFDVILVCVRWYLAHPVSPRYLEEMTAERGLPVDHSTGQLEPDLANWEVFI